jgi:hypothetical protein
MKIYFLITLNDKTIEMFPHYAEEIYYANIEDGKVIIAWIANGREETNTYYSLEDVNRYFKEGYWKKF